MSITKKFSKKLYRENDKRAKEKVIEIFKKLFYNIPNLEIIENPKLKGVDLLVTLNGELQFYIEVERKIVWEGDKFPYENINFPNRKIKYATLDKPTIFLMFSKDWNNYLTITSDDFLNSPIEVVHNKYVAIGEEFRKVDLNVADYNDLRKTIDRLNIEKIK